MESSAGKLGRSLVLKLNLISDLFLLTAAVFGASKLSRTTPQSQGDLLWFAAAAMSAWVFTSSALRHYDPRAASDREPVDDAALASVLVMSAGTILQLANLVAPVTSSLPKAGHFLLFLWPAVLALRLLIFRPLSRQEPPADEVLVIGIGPLGRATGEDLVRQNRRRVLGYLHLPTESGAAPFGKLLGASNELGSVLKSTPVDEVYVAGNVLRQAAAMEEAIRTCEQFGIPFALPAHSFRLNRARPADTRLHSDGYIHYLTYDPKPLRLQIKRLLDVLLSALAIWVLLPLFPIVAALIKLTSKGPVLFRQVRPGLYGKPFNILKFRSMVVNAEELKRSLQCLNEQQGPIFKIKKDPRLTWIGAILRRYSIDELPQLINVLRGDMSLVGPRPLLVEEVAKFEPWQRRRLSVRPGLTCTWQVSGRSQISFEQWMYLDLQYIDHWSLSKDLRLLLKTVPAVLTGLGAS